MSPHVVAGMTLALLVGFTGGCFRYQTHIPGVLDLRSDASEAERARPRPPDEEDLEERADIERFLLGRGVVRQGRSVLIEERHYWVGGFVPLLNTSAAEEIEATIAANGALTDVSVSESYSPTDIMMALVGSLLFPPVGFMLPPYTFTAQGTPVRLPVREAQAEGAEAPVDVPEVPAEVETPRADPPRPPAGEEAGGGLDPVDDDELSEPGPPPPEASPEEGEEAAVEPLPDEDDK